MGRWYSALQSIHTKCLPLGLKLQGSGYGAQLVAQGSLGGAAMMATPCAINARQRYSSGNTAGPNSRADRPLRVLGIESSCDDTAAAVVSEDGRILGEAIRHQHKVHEPNGGIVPGLAAEHHLVNMPDVIREALDNSGLEVSDLDAVAVTRGPGLPASLSVCINAAKTLAAVHRKPLIGVHHMEAHALTARMTASVPFPFLCVLISGGHTLSLVVHDVNEYTQLGTTRDDSVGEAFDKVARLLGIPWLQGSGGGAGPALERLARRGDPSRYGLPVPMNKRESAGSLDFSFSGLKAAVARRVELGEVDLGSETDRADMAASFQHVAFQHLDKKVGKAIERARAMGVDAKTLVVSGGVASNQVIRARLDKLCEENGLTLACPPPRLCTDNGVMIAWAGIERFRKGYIDPYTIDFRQRWPLEELKSMGYPRDV